MRTVIRLGRFATFLWLRYDPIGLRSTDLVHRSSTNLAQAQYLTKTPHNRFGYTGLHDCMPALALLRAWYLSCGLLLPSPHRLR